MELKGKVIVITGSTSGLGLALAKAFMNESETVVISSYHQEHVDTVAKELGVTGIIADVTLETDMENLANETIAKHGRIDLWINNAGIWIPEGIIEDANMERVKKMFDVNVFGVMNGSRTALKQMRTQKNGTILNIISTAALSGRAKHAAYSSSKWAVNGFTKGIREEVREDGIYVLSVFPGGMKTKFFDEAPPANYGEFFEPEYVAEQIVANLKSEHPEEEIVIKRA